MCWELRIQRLDALGCFFQRLHDLNLLAGFREASKVAHESIARECPSFLIVSLDLVPHIRPEARDPADTDGRGETVEDDGEYLGVQVS